MLLLLHLPLLLLLLLAQCSPIHSFLLQNHRFPTHSHSLQAGERDRDSFRQISTSTKTTIDIETDTDTDRDGDTYTDTDTHERFRINKCLSATLSRRAADEALRRGRVSVNGRVAFIGAKIGFGDEVTLDGQLQHWEKHIRAGLRLPAIDSMSETHHGDNNDDDCGDDDFGNNSNGNGNGYSSNERRDFVYLKYWKPAGVTCTTDRTVPWNILDAGKFSDVYSERLFSVGRLDKESTGLLLLTSDGRVNNALLRKCEAKDKIYEVKLSEVPSPAQIEQLTKGVMITTPVQRDNGVKFVSAMTLPCQVQRKLDKSPRHIRVILQEGRNRQIRRMVEAIGLEVIELHRVGFAGVSLSGLRYGTWKELDCSEMSIIRNAIVKSWERSL